MKMAEIDIADENIRNLKAIQNIIHVGDGRETSLNEALVRVLSFYRKFVPYC